MQYHPWLMGMRRAMELMLTGDAMSGREAAESGFATRSFPLDELEQRTLDFAERAAKVPVELQQLNKRSVHRAMEIMGARAAMRAGRRSRRAAPRHGNQGAGVPDGGQPRLHVDVPARRRQRQAAARSARHH